jgi:adenosine deaminase
MDWQRLPKVELHLHMDISLSYNGAKQLVPSLTHEEYLRDYVAPAKCTNLVDFLNRVPKTLNLLQTEQALKVLVDDVFAQLQAENLIYAELRFAPLLHTQQGLTPRQIVSIVNDAVEESVKTTGVEVRLILCSLRHFTSEQSMETVQLVHEFSGSRVVAFDLAGDEAGYPLTAHLPAFEFAKRHGIALTSHAGEASGAQSVWDTLRLINPSRIGHGVRSIEDPALVEHLRRERIHLEICPTCNVQLDVFPTYADHSIDRLYRAYVSLSISTDNRTLTPITLSEEYQKLSETFGWTLADLLACNVNAVNAAFILQADKERLIARLQAGYQVTG